MASYFSVGASWPAYTSGSSDSVVLIPEVRGGYSPAGDRFYELTPTLPAPIATRPEYRIGIGYVAAKTEPRVYAFNPVAGEYVACVNFQTLTATGDFDTMAFYAVPAPVTGLKLRILWRGDAGTADLVVWQCDESALHVGGRAVVFGGSTTAADQSTLWSSYPEVGQQQFPEFPIGGVERPPVRGLSAAPQYVVRTASGIQPTDNPVVPVFASVRRFYPDAFVTDSEGTRHYYMPSVSATGAVLTSLGGVGAGLPITGLDTEDEIVLTADDHYWGFRRFSGASGDFPFRSDIFPTVPPGYPIDLYFDDGLTVFPFVANVLVDDFDATLASTADPGLSPFDYTPGTLASVPYIIDADALVRKTSEAGYVFVASTPNPFDEAAADYAGFIPTHGSEIAGPRPYGWVKHNGTVQAVLPCDPSQETVQPYRPFPLDPSAYLAEHVNRQYTTHNYQLGMGAITQLFPTDTKGVKANGVFMRIVPQLFPCARIPLFTGRGSTWWIRLADDLTMEFGRTDATIVMRPTTTWQTITPPGGTYNTCPGPNQPGDGSIYLPNPATTADAIPVKPVPSHTVLGSILYTQKVGGLSAYWTMETAPPTGTMFKGMLDIFMDSRGIFVNGVHVSSTACGIEQIDALFTGYAVRYEHRKSLDTWEYLHSPASDPAYPVYVPRTQSAWVPTAARTVGNFSGKCLEVGLYAGTTEDDCDPATGKWNVAIPDSSGPGALDDKFVYGVPHLDALDIVAEGLGDTRHCYQDLPSMQYVPIHDPSRMFMQPVQADGTFDATAVELSMHLSTFQDMTQHIGETDTEWQARVPCLIPVRTAAVPGPDRLMFSPVGSSSTNFYGYATLTLGLTDDTAVSWRERLAALYPDFGPFSLVNPVKDGDITSPTFDDDRAAWGGLGHNLPGVSDTPPDVAGGAATGALYTVAALAQAATVFGFLYAKFTAYPAALAGMQACFARILPTTNTPVGAFTFEPDIQYSNGARTIRTDRLLIKGIFIPGVYRATVTIGSPADVTDQVAALLAAATQPGETDAGHLWMGVVRPNGTERITVLGETGISGELIEFELTEPATQVEIVMTGRDGAALSSWVELVSDVLEPTQTLAMSLGDGEAFTSPAPYGPIEDPRSGYADPSTYTSGILLTNATISLVDTDNDKVPSASVAPATSDGTVGVYGTSVTGALFVENYASVVSTGSSPGEGDFAANGLAEIQVYGATPTGTSTTAVVNTSRVTALTLTGISSVTLPVPSYVADLNISDNPSLVTLPTLPTNLRTLNLYNTGVDGVGISRMLTELDARQITGFTLTIETARLDQTNLTQAGMLALTNLKLRDNTFILI